MCKVFIGDTFRFMGCLIEVGDEMVELSMWDYSDKVVKIRVTDDRFHQGENATTAQEEEKYRSFQEY